MLNATGRAGWGYQNAVASSRGNITVWIHSDMVSKARPSALHGFDVTSCFSVLATMEVEKKKFEAVDNPDHGTRFQTIPIKTRMVEEVANSKEADHFCSQTTQEGLKNGVSNQT